MMFGIGVLTIFTMSFVTTFPRPSVIQHYPSGKPDDCDPKSEYMATKHCCRQCPPGFDLGEECHGPGQNSTCYPCRIGYFMKLNNYLRKCQPCQECYNDFVEKAACTTTSNRECRCMSGKYHDGEICLNCTRCTNNQITQQECTESTDTICIDADDSQSEKLPKKTAPIGVILAIGVCSLLIIILFLVTYSPTLSRRLSIGIFQEFQEEPSN
uniref:tumor necrosis factor receptor superfamily member 22-like n=1 Tax=Myxine glutinosa TaxID=7769 RepID=UPI00358F2850